MTVEAKRSVSRTAAPRARATRTRSATGKYIEKVDLKKLPPGMSTRLAQRVRDIGLTTDPSLQPGHGATHCNQAANKYANGFGYHGFEDKRGSPMVANDMFKKMNAPGSGWKKVTAQEAIAAANEGKLAFAAVKGEPHGHIAAVTGEYAPGVPGISQAGSPPNFEFGQWRRKEAPTYFVRE